jgi:hypothetical protein
VAIASGHDVMGALRRGRARRACTVEALPVACAPNRMAERIDSEGRAFKGSQLQTQIYVNRRADELDAAIRDELSTLRDDTKLTWVSPVADRAYAEYQDLDFLRAAGLEAHAASLGDFWPAHGPVWDALAIVESGGERPGVLLAEGKSYPGELFGGGCKATEPARSKIAKAITRTQRWAGIEEEPQRWMGRLYQTGNRLAHLYWLREIVGVRAWMIHFLFVNDPHGPTTREEWTDAMEAANEELGLSEVVVPHVGHVLLDARDRSELL